MSEQQPIGKQIFEEMIARSTLLPPGVASKNRSTEIPIESGDNLFTQIKKGQWNNMVRNWDSTHPKSSTNPSE